MERRAFLQLGVGVMAAAAGGLTLHARGPDGVAFAWRPRRLVPGLPCDIAVDADGGDGLAVLLELRRAGHALSSQRWPLLPGGQTRVPTPVPPETAPFGQFEVWAGIERDGVAADPVLLGGYEVLPLRFGR